MLKIRMLRTRHGTEDGFEVMQYEQGKEYVVTDRLGVRFCNDGDAEYFGRADAIESAQVRIEETERQFAEIFVQALQDVANENT